MKHKDVEKYWEENAENWTKLSRLGYDVYRNSINTPEFFKILPDISGLNGLDIGCGEGYNTRFAAERGSKMTAIDFSTTFIRHAIELEEKNPIGINYQVVNAVNLPFENETFDFVISTMSFMDMKDAEKGLEEAYRVLKKTGLFQFSITHPCFNSTVREWIRDDNNTLKGLVIGNYFKETQGDIEEWIFSAAPSELTKNMRKFRVPRFHRTLSNWLNTLINIGFTLEMFSEPYPDSKTLEKYPNLKSSFLIPWSLIIQCRKY
jgi:ubiquinone/menaquinone biosynthesis C-methylase UbiE